MKPQASRAEITGTETETFKAAKLDYSVKLHRTSLKNTVVKGKATFRAVFLKKGLKPMFAPRVHVCVKVYAYTCLQLLNFPCF